MDLIDAQTVQTGTEAFRAKWKSVARRNTPDQLVEKIRENHEKVQRYARLTLAAIIKTGVYLEALASKTPHGDLMNVVEGLGIKRSTAANYREVAQYAALLESEPGGILEMTLRQALQHTKVYKAASAISSEDDLEGEIDSSKPKPTPRERAARIVARRTVSRAADRLIEATRVHLFEQDVEDVVMDTIARLNRLLDQRKADLEEE